MPRLGGRAGGDVDMDSVIDGNADDDHAEAEDKQAERSGQPIAQMDGEQHRGERNSKDKLGTNVAKTDRKQQEKADGGGEDGAADIPLHDGLVADGMAMTADYIGGDARGEPGQRRLD